MFVALSDTAPVLQLIVVEVVSKWPLSRLASCIRQMTDSITQWNLDKTLDEVANIRDKTSLNIRINSKPPMSILTADHREASISSKDFGFAKATTYRHLSTDITVGVVVV
ncbi:hypothetical protein AAE478_002065 [Parahypoxylon ruwenzoriense]